MRQVVETGTARHAPLDQFEAAGKTGTAEAGDMNHAWFAGFAPFDSPKVSFVAVNEQTKGHGGTHAAPIVARLLEEIWPTVQKME
jgi:penicillin-binding protein 2